MHSVQNEKHNVSIIIAGPIKHEVLDHKEFLFNNKDNLPQPN